MKPAIFCTYHKMEEFVQWRNEWRRLMQGVSNNTGSHNQFASMQLSFCEMHFFSDKYFIITPGNCLYCRKKKKKIFVATYTRPKSISVHKHLISQWFVKCISSDKKVSHWQLNAEGHLMLFTGNFLQIQKW